MKTLLGEIPNLDVNKYYRQLRGVVKWKRANGRGTLEYATGVGKSVSALIIAKKIAMIKDIKIIVVVPKISLKAQWEKHFTNAGLSAEIYVINTVALKDKVLVCDLLILDEIHTYPGDKFYTVFKKVKYKWILGLTATLKRLDGKEQLLSKYAPVVDVITQEEARKKGWISDFIIINLAVKISNKEKDMLSEWDRRFAKANSFFSGDFNTMQSCRFKLNAESYAKTHFPNDDYEEKAKMIVAVANSGSNSVKDRQEFLYKTQHKVNIALELSKRLEMRTIMFGESTEFADNIASALGDKCVCYHSNIKTKTVVEKLSKTFKTIHSATKFSNDVNGKIKNLTVTYNKEVKYSGAKLLKEATQLFSTSKVNIIATAKALDAGFDVPSAELGIEGSRTRNPTQFIQRSGQAAHSQLIR